MCLYSILILIKYSFIYNLNKSWYLKTKTEYYNYVKYRIFIEYQYDIYRNK